MENKSNVNAFKATLPDSKSQLQKLITLEFFALCPNGKRIPVSELCSEYSREKPGLVLRSVEDRLILVIEAVFPGESTPYWCQAFYLSTGQSSGKGGTWLPFNGILAMGGTNRFLYQGWGEPPKERSANEKKLQMNQPWFSKTEFCSPVDRSLCFPSYSKKLVLKRVYGNFFLPEGDYMYRNSRLDRWGTISYLLASHAIGGIEFEYKQSDFLIRSTLGGLDVDLEALENRLDELRPPQPCFVEIARTYPISKPNDVNNYIDKYHATSLMNAFRQEGFFPPGLQFIQVPQVGLGYSLPMKNYWDSLSEYVLNIWLAYKTGKKSIDDVRSAFSEDTIKHFLRNYRAHSVLPNEPEFSFHMNKGSMREGLRPYMGGRKKTKKMKRKGRKTRKH
jgi:hypothetical protein